VCLRTLTFPWEKKRWKRGKKEGMQKGPCNDEREKKKGSGTGCLHDSSLYQGGKRTKCLELAKRTKKRGGKKGSQHLRLYHENRRWEKKKKKRGSKATLMERV